MPEQKLKEEREEEYDEERKRRELERKKREKVEKKGVEKVSKVESPAKSIIQKTTETEVELPILKLEKPKIGVKEVKLSKGIPHVGREELKVKVPIIKLSSPVFEEREIKLNKDIPSIEAVEKKVLKIPLVKLRKTIVRDIISEFNSNIPTIRTKPQTRVRIPIYRILRTPMVREIRLLDEKINEKLLEKLEERRRIEIQKPQVSAISSGTEPSVGGEEEIEEEPPEVIEFAFGGFSKISVRGPIIVLYKELDDDSTIGSFETICIRIFREKRGGHPEVQPIERCSEFNIKEIENYLRAEKKIIRIDLDLLKKDDENKVFKLIFPEHLRETLGRFVVGDVSFLIFKARDERLYEHCKKVLKWLSMNREHPLNILEILPRKLTIEQKRTLTELAWGLSIGEIKSEIKIMGDRPIGLTTFDDIFNKFGKRKHEEYLENLRKEKNGIYAQATKPHEGEESDLHLWIKWFIVKLLSKKYGLTSLLEIEKNIKTEEKLPEGPTPDVWDAKENSVYEVETLFSEDREGKTPERKIYDSIKKYEGTSIREINIVVDNLTFLLHSKGIWGIKKNIKEWERMENKSVKFLTLDLNTHKLVPLSKFFKNLKTFEKC